MKTLKRVLSALLAATLAATTIAVAATMTASAATDNVYEFTPYARHYGWGQWPESATYTDNGYVIMEDNTGFAEQYQLYYPVTTAEDKATMLNLIKTACDDYTAQLTVDVTPYNNCNTNFFGVEEGTAVNAQVKIAYKAIEIDGGKPYSNSFSANGWFLPDSNAHKLIVSVDEYSAWYAEDSEDFKDFEVTAIVISLMNYGTNALSKYDEITYNDMTIKKGAKGIGFTKAMFSPIYITGESAPAVGNNIGEGYTFTPNENREKIINSRGIEKDKYPGTFVINGKSYVQNDDGTQIDGPLGNGADFVRSTNPQPTDPQPTDPQPTDPQPTDPQPTDPQPTDPQPTDPQPTDPQPTDPQPTDPQPPVTVIYGDANSDGTVDLLDVLLIRKYIAKQPVTPDLIASDVTHNDTVDMLDVLKIRKYIAKQPVDLSKA